MTEAQAAQKECHVAMGRDANQPCIGNKCMAWRWASDRYFAGTEPEGFCRLLDANTDGWVGIEKPTEIK